MDCRKSCGPLHRVRNAHRCLASPLKLALPGVRVRRRQRWLKQNQSSTAGVEREKVKAQVPPQAHASASMTRDQGRMHAAGLIHCAREVGNVLRGKAARVKMTVCRQSATLYHLPSGGLQRNPDGPMEALCTPCVHELMPSSSRKMHAAKCESHARFTPRLRMHGMDTEFN